MADQPSFEPTNSPAVFSALVLAYFAANRFANSAFWSAYIKTFDPHGTALKAAYQCPNYWDCCPNKTDPAADAIPHESADRPAISTAIEPAHHEAIFTTLESAIVATCNASFDAADSSAHWPAITAAH